MRRSHKSNKKKPERSSGNYIFRLYITGEAPNSRIAIHNLEEITSNYPEKNYKIEVIDVLKDAERALTDKIVVTPTLIRILPHPEKRIIGNLSEREIVINIMGL